MKKLLIIPAFLLIFTGCNGQQGDLQTNVVAGTVTQVAQNDLLVDYSEALFNEYKGNKPVVLFFHADWCVTCRSIEDGLNQTADTFPEEAKILRVNFDTETEIKKEYGVVIQSMLVFLDGDGNVYKKLASPSIQEIKNIFNEIL